MIVAKHPDVSGDVLKVATINDRASNNRRARPLRKHFECFVKIRFVGHR